MAIKIILTGYMASGKSAVAKILAQILDLKCLDLDKFIEEKENLSVENIFKTKGEIYFRNLEIKYLNWIIENENNFVLSLGGGTPTFGENYKVLQLEGIYSFYLQTSVNETIKRLSKTTQVRPLLQNIDPNDWEDFITKHLFERNYYYNFAKYKVKTDLKSSIEVANEITNTIKYEIDINNKFVANKPQ